MVLRRKRRHLVYRVYSRVGRLVYVGITSRPLKDRVDEHRASGRFAAGELHRVEHHRYRTRRRAASVERRLIERHRPKRNVDGNPGGRWHRRPKRRRRRSSKRSLVARLVVTVLIVTVLVVTVLVVTVLIVAAAGALGAAVASYWPAVRTGVIVVTVIIAGRVLRR